MDGKEASTPQPAPTDGQYVVLPYVLQDLEDRAEMGKEKYGTYLQTHNGRSALLDAYQEALDLVMYLRQALLELEDSQ
jgi:hypothetical protein